MSKLYRILGKRGRITIPYEIRQRVGFQYNDVLSFTETSDGRTVMVKREKICDNCKGTRSAADKQADGINKVSTGGKDAILDQISTNHPLHSKIMNYYNSIAASVQTHSKVPSFSYT